jgi:hypothetical protein
MTEHAPRLHAAYSSANHVQVGSANRAGGESHDGVALLFDFGFGNVIDPNVTNAVEDNCFHC